MDKIEESINLADKKLTLQVGKLAQAADVSIFARLGDTCILATVVVGREREDIDYFPLTIDYVEKLYAGGRIKGSRWVKREGKPSDEAVLMARLIDRSVRPLFPKAFKKQVQIIITLLSVDGVNSPEILSAISVSAALHLSSIPWGGPISTIRVGFVKTDSAEGSYVINPTEEVQKFSPLDLVVSSTKDRVVMIETQAEELPEDVILKGVEKAKEENKKIIEFIESLAKKIGKTKETVAEKGESEEIMQILKKKYSNRLDEIILKRIDEKDDSDSAIEAIIEEISEEYKDSFDRKTISATISKFTFQKIRDNVLKNKKRIDGRGLTQVRDIFVETSVLPRTHGSVIFQRGQTQVLAIATLGASTLEQLIESPEGEEAKRYIHHYYMPPYSVGEVGRMMFPSRREVGHGALAEKAIEPVLPSQDEFPYAIRVVSEIMSSNGSTSMASTCGSSLALMDAGVPIKSAIAGISIGMVSKDDEVYVLLTDILGIEDFAGDMDFKIAGSTYGITAIQLDVKNKGLTQKMIKEALEMGRVARLFILEKMNSVLDKPRKELSKYAPKVLVLVPPADKIGEIIGPGGKNIKQIIAKTGCEINITDDGKVSISGLDRTAVDQAAALVKNVYREINMGEQFTGEVKRILPFGAFVEFLPGKEGMVHVSKMGKGFVKDPHEVVKIGQEVTVKVIEIDNLGRINLALLT